MLGDVEGSRSWLGVNTSGMKMEAVRRCWTAIRRGKEKQSVLKNAGMMGPTGSTSNWDKVREKEEPRCLQSFLAK